MVFGTGLEEYFSEKVIQEIKATVESEPKISRRALSRKVYAWLDWKGPNGKLNTMSCRVALLKLHRKGVIELPECRVNGLFQPKKNKGWDH